MTLDIAHLRPWIGREMEAEDIVTPRLVAEYRATFAPHLAAMPDSDAPPALHWCLSPAIVPMAEIGPDGHPERGGFLPPVPLPRRMWAGGEIETHAALRIGDVVTRRSRIADVSVKEGRSGTLCFVAVAHDYATPRGLCVRERHDIVYRDVETRREPAATAPPSAPPRPADLAWTVPTTPLLLFRYSAMTFNGHRIHYDLPYVTGVEGYGGLVVHGPIQASLLLNIATALAGEMPHRFRYRGLSPLIAGEPVTISAAKGPDGTVACWTRSADGRVCMDATAFCGPPSQAMVV